METYTFQEQIKSIREEALKIGFSESTMNSYQNTWQQFIIWKDRDDFFYKEDEYSQFLLEHYDFDIITYTKKSKSRHQQLMRSKRILDDWDTYKLCISKRVVNNNQKDLISKVTERIIIKYKNYCANVNYNCEKVTKEKINYITNLLSYFEQHGLKDIKDLSENLILDFLRYSEDKSTRSKGRYFGILRDFLKYLYDENILNVNYAYLIPSCKRIGRKRIPTYLKVEQVSELLNSIPRVRKIEKRNYAIILIAAELGMRIGDILNLKFENIDWTRKEIIFIQNKTANKNVLPLSNEVGWALIDYIKNGRPITICRNIFVKHSQPYNEINNFSDFNKYFDKINVELNENNKKGIHNLRHGTATRLLDQEIPLPIISETLGHSSTDTTRIYLKVDKKRLKECGLEVEL